MKAIPHSEPNFGSLAPALHRSLSIVVCLEEIADKTFQADRAREGGALVSSWLGLPPEKPALKW